MQCNTLYSSKDLKIMMPDNYCSNYGQDKIFNLFILKDLKLLMRYIEYPYYGWC